jgi:hypothetical protein
MHATNVYHHPRLLGFMHAMGGRVESLWRGLFLPAHYTKIYARISAGPQDRGATVTLCGRTSVPLRWVPPQSVFGLQWSCWVWALIYGPS